MSVYAVTVPYAPNSNFDTPSDDAGVWRYMDLAKFVQLLEDKGLWFARLDHLDDPREGCLTIRERNRFPSSIDQSAMDDMEAVTRTRVHVNCWHCSDHESVAMWSLYAGSLGGLAIRSTVGALKREVAGTSQEVYIGKADYTRWQEDKDKSPSILAMSTRKEFAFAHENEVRLAIFNGSEQTQRQEISPIKASVLSNHVATALQQTTAATLGLHELIPVAQMAVGKYLQDQADSALPTGIRVAVNIHTVFTKVVIAPNQPDWVKGMVMRLMQRYDLAQAVENSVLNNSR